MNALVVAKLSDVSVSLDVGIVAKRDAMVTTAKSITAVSDDWALEDAVECLKKLQALSKVTEKSRTDVKAPVLDLGRVIDAKAKEFCQPIDAEIARVNRLVTTYQAEKRRIAEEAERARQAELRRIEEEQRRAAAEEARRQREAAEAEAKRIRAEEESRVAFDNQDEQKAMAEAAESERKRKEAEAAAEAERVKQANLAAEKARAQAQVPATIAKVSGLITKEVWRFELVDLKAIYSANPALCRLEANTSAINEAIKRGMTECPGLRIWKETKTEVRS